MDPDLQLTQSLKDAVVAKDRGLCRHLMGLDGESPPPVKAVLRSLSLAGSHHDEKRFPTPHGIIFADAVRDLVPTYAGEPPTALLDGALDTFLVLDYGPSDPEKLLLQEGETVEVVSVSELEDALVGEGLHEVLRVTGRLLSVIRTKEYFLENLLELAARHITKLGHTLIFTMSATKAVNDMTGGILREVAYNLLTYLTSRRLSPLGRVKGDPRPVSWDQLFLRGMKDPGLLGHNVIFLAHAYQAQRYAEVKRDRILALLRHAFTARFPGWDGEDVEAPETDAPAATGEKLTSLDPSSGMRLRDALVTGDAETAKGIVREWWGRVEDPDPVYRWLAEACVKKGDPAQTHDLIYLNACRWGAHLLKDSGLAMADRSVEQIAGLSPREMED
jgi:hypothetical protein